MAENGPPEAVLPFADYLNYYHLEQYLFEQVGPRFHSEHSIGAFDFFSIVIWKTNRAKSKIAERLRRKAQPGEDLDASARRLTASLYRAADACERLRLLLDEKEWGFRLPMASAVLTVLWPAQFTVYDIRVCDQLEEVLGSDRRIFKRMANWVYSDRLWQAYQKYIAAVKEATPDGLTLRDGDRYLWARSAAEQLKEGVQRGFKTESPEEMATPWSTRRFKQSFSPD